VNNMTALDRAFTKARFTLIRHVNHKIWRCPCGHTQVTTAGTRSKGRAFENAMAQLARTLRACQMRESA
jgi:hypothetical protein